jgi:phospholipid-transporting ATPase
VLRNFVGAQVECEPPNEFLYRFNGSLSLGENSIGLGFDQLLLRGSSLRTTDWIYGLVVYTGHETKIMKNSVNAKAKQSKLEKATNVYIFTIVIIQLCICMFAAVFATIW